MGRKRWMKQNEIRINVEEKLQNPSALTQEQGENMSNIVKGTLTGMFCETIFMVILSCLGHIEWRGVANSVGICVLLGIGKIIG